jgi:hypothetical protein
MNCQTEELLNARVGSMKYKHVLAIDLIWVAFTAYLYIHHAGNFFFLVLIAVNVCVAFIHYRAAKAQVVKL